jgi:cytoskeletal protein CcmA (bactofilin family)
MSLEIREAEVNLVAEGTRLEGKLRFDQVTRVHGTLVGEVHAQEGSTLILGETSVTEGVIHADTLWVDGFVRGDIVARKRVVISRTGRVIGDIRAPSLEVQFGSYFEGKCTMDVAPQA